MDILLALLCCGSLVFTTAFGVGLAFALERFLGALAYVVGAILPVFVFTALYTVYHIWVRANPCEPAGSLSCEEPFLTAFLLFVAVAFFLLLANVLAQTSLYLFLYSRRQTIPAALYEESADPSGAEMASSETAWQEQSEPVAELPTDEPDTDTSQWSGLPPGAVQEQYGPETDFSGLPPDAPEDEPPNSAS